MGKQRRERERGEGAATQQTSEVRLSHNKRETAREAKRERGNERKASLREGEKRSREGMSK